MRKTKMTIQNLMFFWKKKEQTKQSETKQPIQTYKIYGTQENCPYKIIVPEDVWARMQEYVRQEKGEMGGHIVVIEDKDKLYLNGLYLPVQDVTSASYKPNHRELAKYPQILPHIKGWFHSHVNFGVFWSPDDEATIDNSLNTFGKYCISIVMNKGCEYKIRLDIRNSNAVTVYDNLPLIIVLDVNETIKRECKEELNLKVKKNVFEHLMRRSFFKGVKK